MQIVWCYLSDMAWDAENKSAVIILVFIEFELTASFLYLCFFFIFLHLKQGRNVVF